MINHSKSKAMTTFEEEICFHCITLNISQAEGVSGAHAAETVEWGASREKFEVSPHGWGERDDFYSVPQVVGVL